MRSPKAVFISILVAALVVVVVLAMRKGPDAAGDSLLVVASIYPLADIVKNVGGDRVVVETLLPPGASPHTFEPTPAQIRLLHRAAAYFQIGLDLEFWADKMLASVHNKHLKVVTVSAGIVARRFGQREGLSGENTHEDHAHRRGEYDPHVWLDPVLAKTIVHNVVDALCEIDAEHADSYRHNGKAYVERLDELDEKFRATVGTLPSRRVVVFHDAYSYLARRYGLEIVGVIEEAPGKEATPKKVESIVRAIRKSGVRAVFVEPQFSPKVAEAIAREAAVAVVEIDPIGTADDPERATYLDLMRTNLRHLREAMGE